MSDRYLPDNGPRDILLSLDELAAKKLPHAPTFRKAADEITRLRAERDALAACLAPVDDDALVEMAAVAIRRNKFERTGRLDCFDPSNLTPEELGEGRAAIAAIRPHIVAAEYEAAARFIEENVLNYSSGDQNYWSHRKGDNSHGLEYAREFRARASLAVAIGRSGK